MPYIPRAGVSFVSVADQIICLDTVTDRYLGLSTIGAASFRRLIDTDVQSHQPEPDERHILALGLLHWGDEASTRPASEPPAARDFIPPQSGGSSPSRILQACAAMVATRRRLARRSLSVSLDRLTLAKTRIKPVLPADAVKVARIVMAYRRATRLIPSHDRCLSNSLALAEAVTRAGCDCTLVFGVAIRPFAAHCWVQMDDAVLNDGVDHVRGFVPILTL